MTRYDAPKAEWGDGPWQNEPDHLNWKDEATGYPCMIHRNNSGALCGYVAVPPGHPFYGLSYDGVPKKVFGDEYHRTEPNEVGQKLTAIDVHGGLTYSDECSGELCHVPEPGEPDNVWWFGFDCAHCFDFSPKMAHIMAGSGIEPYRDEVYRDLAYVQSECAKLAKQLLDAAT
jgi:hypothetical protein